MQGIFPQRLCCLSAIVAVLAFGATVTADTRQQATVINLGRTHPAPARFYQWVNDRKLLFVGAGGKSLYLRDLRTARTRRLGAPPHGIGKQDNAARYSAEVSPDGRWAVWLETDQFAVTTATLDGRRITRRSHQADTEDGFLFQWLPDSRRWVELEWWGMGAATGEGCSISLHSLDHPGMERGLKVVPDVLIPPEAFGSVVVTPDSRILTHSAQAPLVIREHVTIYACGFDRNTMPFHKTIVALPAGAALIAPDALVFSPQGDRIAWRFSFGLPASTVHMLLAREAALREELWVSRLDGSGMRRIWKQEKSAAHPVSLQSVRWLPSGRRVSFVHDNVLWTVAAPELSRFHKVPRRSDGHSKTTSTNQRGNTSRPSCNVNMSHEAGLVRYKASLGCSSHSTF